MVLFVGGNALDATIASIGYILKSTKIKESIFQFSEKKLFFGHIYPV